MTMISQRPPEVDDGVQVGHWEGDCVMRAGNRSAIGMLVERTTRFLILVHVPTGRPTAEAIRAGITAALNRLPASLRRTLTWIRAKNWRCIRRSPNRPEPECSSVTRTPCGNAAATRT
jgi:IS30 family transposase